MINIAEIKYRDGTHEVIRGYKNMNITEGVFIFKWENENFYVPIDIITYCNASVEEE
jgi:hypothetical protein